jgi:hypothetical protein
MWLHQMHHQRQAQQAPLHNPAKTTQRNTRVFLSDQETIILFLDHKSGWNHATANNSIAALNWEEDCVLKRLIVGTRAHSLTIDMTIEPQSKRPKTTSEGTRIKTPISDPSDNLSVSGATQAATSNSLTSS